MKTKNEVDLQVLFGMMICSLLTGAFIYGFSSHRLTATAAIIFPLLICFLLSVIILPPWIKFFNELRAPWMGAGGYFPYAVNSRPYKSSYDHVLNYCEQVGKDQYFFYRVIKTPFFKKFIKRTYMLEHDTTTRIANPLWMNSIASSYELDHPTPTNAPAHPYLGCDVSTKFNQNNVYIIISTVGLFGSPHVEEYIYFKFDRGWRRIPEHKFNQELDISPDVIKMEWNIYQACN